MNPISFFKQRTAALRVRYDQPTIAELLNELCEIHQSELVEIETPTREDRPNAMLDKTTHYRQLIKNLLNQYAGLVSRQLEPDMQTHVIFDDERDEYLWLQTGWSKQNRVYGTTLHVRLQNNKIWIEQDWTEDGIATDLIKAGVPKSDIVLAFHEPEVRSMTEFAIT